VAFQETVSVARRRRAIAVTMAHLEQGKDKLLMGGERKMVISDLENRISVALGGRSAERLIFGEVATGAQSDLKVVTDLAKKMVCQWGMSEKVGPVAFSRGEEHTFLGRKLAEEKSFSEEMAWMIDQEISALIRQGEKVADDLLLANRPRLEALATALQEEETLDGARVGEILQIGQPEKPVSCGGHG